MPDKRSSGRSASSYEGLKLIAGPAASFGPFSSASSYEGLKHGGSNGALMGYTGSASSYEGLKHDETDVETVIYKEFSKFL